MKSVRRQLAFTLIELMVVITIIGIMAGMMVVSVGIPSGSNDLKHEADRLRAVLSLAAEEAVIQQMEIGAEFNESEYRFMRWEMPPVPNEKASAFDGPTPTNTPVALGQDDNTPEQKPKWQLLQSDDTLRHYRLPDGMRMQIEVDYQQVDLAQSQTQQRSRITTETTLTPTLYFLSSGEMTPFRIELFSVADAQHPLYVEGNSFGQVEVLLEPRQR